METLEFTNYILNPHALTYLVVGVVIIVLGVMILLENIKSSIHLAFYALSLSIAWSLIAQAIAYSTSSGELALFWYKILWVGAIFIAPSAYTFTVIVLGIPKTREQIILAYVTFVPFLFTLPGDLFVAAAGKYSRGYGAGGGIIQVVFLGFFAFYLSFCIFHQARHAFSNSLPKVKRDQAKILLASFLVAYFAALDFLPVFGIPFYPIRFIPFFIWLIITAYAIRHFKLLEVTPSIAAPAIIATLADPLLVTNNEGKVTIANQAAVNLLQTELKEVFNEPLVNFLPTASDLLEETKNLPIEKTTLISGREAVIKTKQGREIPVSVAVGVVRDEKGAPLGLAVICHSIKGLKEQIQSFSKQAKDLEETKVALLNVLEDDRELQQELRKEKTSVEEKVEERTKQLQKEQEE